MPAPNTIAVEKLARLVGTPGCPTLIDLRRPAPAKLIPGSIVRDPDTVSTWSDALPEGPAITIDANGAEAAHGVAAWLRSERRDAEVLDGGFDRWAKDSRPMVASSHLPPRDASGRTVWVTRARPKVDRIACPWLIRRFIDPEARFLFVPAAEVLSVAASLGAEPFDVAGDGVIWSHRGELCTFDVLIEAFGLGDFEPLRHLATIVRGADTDRLDLIPEAAGLLAISLGLSRLHADDEKQLEAGMLVYDALYRWCRDARGETHDWASHASARAKVPA
jgi:rhodanese-related sulfurtransferase